MTKRVTKAIIPAAGLGTRFLPATKAVPKEMLPIVDVPTIQLVVEEAVRAGARQVVVINGRHKQEIENHFDYAVELEQNLREKGKEATLREMEAITESVSLISVRQKRPLGLGHAVLCGRDVVGEEPFAVLLGDDLIDDGGGEPGIGQLARVYEETGAGAVAVMEVPPGSEHMYGIVDGEEVQDGRIRIRDMVEKPSPGTAPTRLAVIGRYVLPPEIWPMLESTEPGHGGEIQLTDALRELAAGPGLYGVRVDGERHDAGDKLGFLRANIAYALKRPELRDGVLAMLREMSGSPDSSG